MNTKAMTDEQIRESFEEYQVSEGISKGSLIRSVIDHTEYKNYQIQEDWKLWQAALSAPMTTDNAKLIEALENVLKADGGKSCGCINKSRELEIAYETYSCPHQLAAKALSDYHAQSKEQP